MPNNNAQCRIFLPGGGKNQNEDLFAAVNGRRFQLRRGCPLVVPAYLAEVIARAVADEAHLAAVIEEISGSVADEDVLA